MKYSIFSVHYLGFLYFNLLTFVVFNAYSITADENSTLKQQMILANAYFEAGNSSYSEELYEQLLDNTLSAEQSALIHYNLGIVLISEQRLSEAIASFSQSLYQSQSPLLNSYTLIGMAYVHYYLTESNNSSLLTYEGVDLKSLLFLSRAQTELGLAKQLNCAGKDLEKNLTNEQQCAQLDLLKDLENTIKKKIALIKQQLETNTRTPSNSKQKLFLLKSELNQLLYQVNFLSEVENSNKQLLKNYLSLTITQINHIPQLFNAITNPKLTTLQKDNLSNAQQAFLKFLKELENEDLISSKETLIESNKLLDILIQSIWNNSPFISGEDLLIAYDRALAVDPLQELSLKEIHHIQTIFEEKINLAATALKIDTGQLNTLKDSTDYLAQSIKLSSEKQFLEARIWTENSRRLLKMVLDHYLIDDSPLNSQRILEKAIEQQLIAARWSYFWLQIEHQKNSSTSLQNLFLNVQTQAINEAHSFLPTVMSEQVRSFQQANHCQKKPWATVLPLFDKGLVSATEALNLIKIGPAHAAATLDKQEKTLENWIAALTAMKSQAENDSNQKEKDLNRNETLTSENPVSLLLEMEHDDRPQPVKTQPLTKPGLKPW